MDQSNDRVINNQIRQQVSDSVPPEVESRLRSQLAVFRSQLSSPKLAGTRPVRNWTRPAAWWRLGVTSAAVVVLVAVAGLIFRPQTGFAEVTQAVLKQPWIHLRTVYSDQSIQEAWISPVKDICASQWRGATKFEDYRLRIYYSYVPAEQVVYRGPIVDVSQAGQFESLTEGLKVLLQGKLPGDKALSHLAILGPNTDNMKVLEQRVEQVTEQDHQWLDYRVTVKFSHLTEPVRMLFRVDASTKLPHLSRMEGQVDGKPATSETHFDFPEKGPTDIYDLGVAKTAKLIDRVPAGDLKRIIESLKAGRERMDNYRAVFVTERDSIGHNWWITSPEILFHKGNRYRRDLVVAGPSHKETLQPNDDVDRRSWWFKYAKQFQFFPNYVQVGLASYQCDIKRVTNPDGSIHHEIASVDKYVYNLLPGDLFPVDYSMRPEFVCRPPMGIGNEDQEPTLDLHPATGPAGCILLSVRRTKKLKQDQGMPDVCRFWLDPQRDYIAMRSEMAKYDENGKEILMSQHIIEETARSPQGVWYATRVRIKDAVRLPNGKREDQLYHIYVDFDADLPDSLFEPPTPQRIR